MKNAYVVFRIQISESEYGYDGTQGEAEIRIQIPQEHIKKLDAGNLFGGILLAAMVEFEENMKEIADDESD